jgi:hypothetical protein
MSFIGCTFNYKGCTSGTADYMIHHDGDDVSPVCSGCLKRALETLGSRVVKVVPVD